MVAAFGLVFLLGVNQRGRFVILVKRRDGFVGIRLSSEGGVFDLSYVSGGGGFLGRGFGSRKVKRDDDVVRSGVGVFRSIFGRSVLG